MQNLGHLIAEATSTLTPSNTEASRTSDWRPKLDAYEPSLVRAAAACAKFIADMAAMRAPYWLTFAGIQGSGKTMLARQLFEQAKQHNPGDYRNNPCWVSGTGMHDESNRRPNCVWLHATNFADRMRGGEYDLPEFLQADFLVVIDDLGSVRDKTEFVADGLYRFADRRMHRWAVWTTNLKIEEISLRMDARIGSRLLRDENRLVTITAPDYALRKRP